VPGAVLILIGLFVIGPILLFLVGAIWSGLFGWILADDADRRTVGDPAEGKEAQTAA
jgi:hypothetical protein